MPGKSVKIGPFANGLNNVAQSGESKDTEVVELINFETGPDSSLWSRPPLELIDGSLIAGISATYSLLGIYRTSVTEWYLVYLVPLAAGVTEVRAILNGDFVNAPLVIRNIPATSKVTAMVQLNDLCYFCVSATSAISGFKWKKDTAYSDITVMKKGNCMIAFKSRLWVAGIDTASTSSRMYFSTIDDTGIRPDLWGATDFFDVAPGEGGYITALLPMNSSIMVFKNDGTWRFSYATSPKGGDVVRTSGTVGAANPSSVVEFENYVYVYDQGRLYEVVNNSFTQLNRFVKFEADGKSVDSLATGVDVSLLGRRVVVRYFNTLYVYSIDNQAWSQWRSYFGTPGRFVALPVDSSSTNPSVYVAPSKGQTQNPSVNLLPPIVESEMPYFRWRIGEGNTITLSGVTLTVTTDGTVGFSRVYFNQKKGTYNLKVSPGQKYRLTGNVTISSGSVFGRLTVLKRDGSTSIIEQAVSATTDIVYTIPANAVLANFSLTHTTSVTQSYTINGMSFVATSDISPVSLIRITDANFDLQNTVELIECHVKTKAYDFQNPAAMKRLFWWGADIKTNRYVDGKVSPVAIKLPPKWGDLKAYTHGALKAGTWGNPLSFLQVNLSVADGGDPSNALTENGRIFIKLMKSLRFRQVSFELDMTSLGTKTSACKVHTIMAFVAVKEKVVDRFS